MRTSARSLAALVASAALLLAGTATATAQPTAPDPRWNPWVGCWQNSETSMNAPSTLVCVVPAAGKSAVDVVSIMNGKEVQRDRIDATGERRPSSKDGCTGWETAQWSADGRRVYTKSELACAGAIRRASNGLLAMSAAGEWIAVQGVRAGGGNGMQVARYRDAGVSAGLPAEIASALSGRSVALSASRIAAGADIAAAEIVEAARQIETSVVQAWLVESGQRFELSAKQLVALADAGVPGSVTDVMVALGYPKKFTLDPAEYDLADGAATRVSNGRPVPAYGIFGNSAYGMGYDPYYSGYGYSRYGYSRYGYSPYGYSPYGYSPYGMGAGWYFGRSPYVIIGGGRSAPRGQAINDRGYTPRGSATSDRTARPRPSTGAAGGARATGTRATGSGSGSGSGARRSGRTAKGRN